MKNRYRILELENGESLLICDTPTAPMVVEIDNDQTGVGSVAVVKESEVVINDERFDDQRKMHRSKTWESLCDSQRTHTLKVDHTGKVHMTPRHKP